MIPPGTRATVTDTIRGVLSEESSTHRQNDHVRAANASTNSAARLRFVVPRHLRPHLAGLGHHHHHPGDHQHSADRPVDHSAAAWRVELRRDPEQRLAVDQVAVAVVLVAGPPASFDFRVRP